MPTKYIQAAMCRAHYEILPDDGMVYGSIPGLQGVYTHEATVEECREELQSVLEDWILVGIRRDIALPVVEGIDLTAKAPVECLRLGRSSAAILSARFERRASRGRKRETNTH